MLRLPTSVELIRLSERGKLKSVVTLQGQRTAKKAEGRTFALPAAFLLFSPACFLGMVTFLQIAKEQYERGSYYNETDALDGNV